MTMRDIDDYFGSVVLFMKSDIGREIALAKTPTGAGNLLCALGLVSYTEALGLLRVWNQRATYGTPQECFEAFFDPMAAGAYKRWRTEWEARLGGVSIYFVLRCGLVHEYRPKVDSEFWIGSGETLGLEEIGGNLIFKVEPYYGHFCAEADALYAELRLMRDPQVPPAKGMLAPVAGTTPVVSPTS